MTLREHAQRLIIDDCDAIVRQQRSNCMMYPQFISEADASQIKARVYRQLKASGQYRNIQLWWFAFTILLDLVVQYIRNRNKAEDLPLLQRRQPVPYDSLDVSEGGTA